MKPLITCTCLCALLATAGAPALAEDGMEVTPYRPSISNPAQLPTPGQLELELLRGGRRPVHRGIHTLTSDSSLVTSSGLAR